MLPSTTILATVSDNKTVLVRHESALVELRAGTQHFFLAFTAA
jgi:hypothetical protein